MNSAKEIARANVRLAFTKAEWALLKANPEFMQAWEAMQDKSGTKEVIGLGAKIVFWDSRKKQ